MRKLIILGLILVVLGSIFYFGAIQSTSEPTAKIGVDSGAPPTALSSSQFGSIGANPTTGSSASVAVEVEGNDLNGDIQPAARVYKSAAEALEAVKKGATEYNDLIVEQFRAPGPDCTWCPEFYQSVKGILSDPQAKKEEISYLGEILAISDNVDNLKFLSEQVEKNTNPELSELYAQALELAVGGDGVVHYFGELIASPNERLQEASVAALTNQGVKQAAEILYKHTVEKGDADGYYEVGMGIGEFVPDDDALPFFQEQVLKRDQYSHLAVKALLNAGLPGLRIVFESLMNSKDVEGDKKLLEGAVEHVLVDKDTEEFVHQALNNNPNAALTQFGNEILSRFQPDEEAEE